MATIENTNQPNKINSSFTIFWHNTGNYYYSNQPFYRKVGFSSTQNNPINFKYNNALTIWVLKNLVTFIIDQLGCWFKIKLSCRFKAWVHPTFDRSHYLEIQSHFQPMRTEGNHPKETRITYVALAGLFFLFSNFLSINYYF